MINGLIQRLIEERNVTLTLTINVSVNANVTTDELAKKVIEALKDESHSTIPNMIHYPKQDNYPKQDISSQIDSEPISTLSTPVVIASQKCLEEVTSQSQKCLEEVVSVPIVSMNEAIPIVSMNEEPDIPDGELYVVEQQVGAQTKQEEVANKKETCVITQPDKPIHTPKGTYTKIKGEKSLKYVIRDEMIEGVYGSMRMSCRLENVYRLVKSKGDIEVELKSMFYKAQQRNILKKLIKAIKEKRLVLPIQEDKVIPITKHTEPTVTPITQKVITVTDPKKSTWDATKKIMANVTKITDKSGINWDDVKSTHIDTLPALVYREKNGKIQLTQGGYVCHCTWERINTFTMLHGKQLTDQIALSFPTKECHMIVTMFVKEVKSNHIIDPDAQYRQFVNNTTKPNEESGKVEIEIPI